ncbi:MAG: hypothetical protein HQK49_01795 [Oligoflexia bacterium]|nr:hypothetical protein [Oligoflexia bacterium]
MFFKEIANYFSVGLYKVPLYQRSRAKSLVYVLMCTGMLGILFAFGIGFIAKHTLNPAAIVQLTCLPIFALSGLFLVRNGNFKAASIVTGYFLALISIMGFFVKANKEQAIFAISNSHYILIVVALLGIFGSRRQLLAIGSSLFIINITFFIITKNLYTPELLKIAQLSVVSGSFSIGLVTLISYFTISATENSITTTLNESINNKKLNVQLNDVVNKRMKELDNVNKKFALVNQEIGNAEKTLGKLIKETNAYSMRSGRTINLILDNSKQGEEIIQSVVTSVKSIEDANQHLNSITKIIEQIKTKTTIINDIVFETKILSFNASIEAARAGEYGSGFAVVAQEVGYLAKISGDASLEIANLLDDSLGEVQMIIEDIKNQSIKTREVSNSSLNKFNEISKDISTLCNEIQNIKNHTIEQEHKIKEHLQLIKAS